MDRHKQYISVLALLLLLTVVALSALGEQNIEVYVSLFAVSYFAAAALFRPRRKTLDFVGGALFLAFCVIVIQKILVILS